jgi:hypothetical protein
MESGLASVQLKRDELENREEIAQRLRERKINNTKTSIAFGYDAVDYRSEAQRNQNAYMGGDTRDIRSERAQQKELKKALVRTNFSLGDEAVTDYTRTSTVPDPTGHIGEYTGQLNSDVKNFIKKSSVNFGQDKPVYQTTGQVSMAYHGNNNNFEQIRQEMRKLKRELGSSNFELGQEKVEYVSDYKRAFVHDQSKVVKAISATEVAEDLRKCHFNFGYDNTLYETDAQQNQKNILQAGTRDLAADRQNQKDMKANLMRTNLSLVHDESYT